MAFTRWRATGIGNARCIGSDDLLVVEVPGLKLHRELELGDRALVAGNRSDRSFHTAAGCPYVFVLTGDVLLSTMTEKYIPHQLKVEAIDAATGKIAWRYGERLRFARRRQTDVIDTSSQ